MYHRILPKTDQRFLIEEPGMITTPDSFRQHLREVKRLFTVLPLSEWVERKQANKPLPPRACAITFDDGWLDNHQHALPILKAEQTPATIFAVSHMIDTQREFWPNRISRALSLPAEQLAHPTLAWLVAITPRTDGLSLTKEQIAAVIGACKRFSDDEINTRLDEAESSGVLAKSNAPSLMSWNQLREMQASGFVEVGSHTCNHYRLVPELDSSKMSAEITQSKSLLEQQLDQPVTLFCYPNGDVSPQAIDTVRQHYQAAVTTRRGINTISADNHSLLRIGIHEDVADDPTNFRARLSGWT
jgi:peptidoglycan/xylan/chitin deacetylase (PgdA/CDA1 family)